MEKKRIRNEPGKDEIKIRQDAISSQIRKDHLKSQVSFVESKELPFLLGKIRQTDKTRTSVRQLLAKDYGSSIVSVLNGKVAIVKRPT